jgi:hypothetical protein
MLVFSTKWMLMADDTQHAANNKSGLTLIFVQTPVI